MGGAGGHEFATPPRGQPQYAARVMCAPPMWPTSDTASRHSESPSAAEFRIPRLSHRTVTPYESVPTEMNERAPRHIVSRRRGCRCAIEPCYAPGNTGPHSVAVESRVIASFGLCFWPSQPFSPPNQEMVQERSPRRGGRRNRCPM